MWIKNTNKKSDAMLTFATLSFFVVTLNMFLSSFESISYGDINIMFKALDGSVMAVYLGSTFTAYVSRRWTDRKYGQGESAQMPEGAVSQIIQAVGESLPGGLVSQASDVALSIIEQQGVTEESSQPSKKRPKT
jgi:hypothetical protein